jgi:hypothetical protein
MQRLNNLPHCGAQVVCFSRPKSASKREKSRPVWASLGQSRSVLVSLIWSGLVLNGLSTTSYPSCPLPVALSHNIMLVAGMLPWHVRLAGGKAVIVLETFAFTPSFDD